MSRNHLTLAKEANKLLAQLTDTLEGLATIGFLDDKQVGLVVNVVYKMDDAVEFVNGLQVKDESQTFSLTRTPSPSLPLTPTPRVKSEPSPSISETAKPVESESPTWSSTYKVVEIVEVKTPTRSFKSKAIPTTIQHETPSSKAISTGEAEVVPNPSSTILDCSKYLSMAPLDLSPSTIFQRKAEANGIKLNVPEVDSITVSVAKVESKPSTESEAVNKVEAVPVIQSMSMKEPEDVGDNSLPTKLEKEDKSFVQSDSVHELEEVIALSQPVLEEDDMSVVQTESAKEPQDVDDVAKPTKEAVDVSIQSKSFDKSEDNKKVSELSKEDDSTEIIPSKPADENNHQEVALQVKEDDVMTASPKSASEILKRALSSPLSYEDIFPGYKSPFDQIAHRNSNAKRAPPNKSRTSASSTSTNTNGSKKTTPTKPHGVVSPMPSPHLTASQMKAKILENEAKSKELKRLKAAKDANPWNQFDAAAQDKELNDRRAMLMAAQPAIDPNAIVYHETWIPTTVVMTKDGPERQQNGRRQKVGITNSGKHVAVEKAVETPSGGISADTKVAQTKTGVLRAEDAQVEAPATSGVKAPSEETKAVAESTQTSNPETEVHRAEDHQAEGAVTEKAVTQDDEGVVDPKKPVSYMGHVQFHADGDVIGASAPAIGKDSKGYKMMQKLGHQAGSGLGKDGTGILIPLTATVKNSRAGLGMDFTTSSGPSPQVTDTIGEWDTISRLAASNEKENKKTKSGEWDTVARRPAFGENRWRGGKRNGKF